MVINGKVIAAAVRRPPEVVGSGNHTVRQLVEAQSRRRAAATHGESLDPRRRRHRATPCAKAGCDLDDVLPANERLVVRRTANLHTGGTIRDVTDDLNPKLAKVAIDAADAIGIPVTGIDLMVPSVEGEEYVFIEANERPGPGQSRAAAHRAGVRRPALPAHRGDAVGLATRPDRTGLRLDRLSSIPCTDRSNVGRRT